MTVSITATPEPDGRPPAVRLDVTSDQSSVSLYRVAQDGSRTPVRSYDGGSVLISGGSALVFDYEAPLGEPVRYTADGTGVTDSALVALDTDAVWLVHVGVPALSQPITVLDLGPRERPANQSVRYPIGRRTPIVVTDGRRKAAAYDMLIGTETLEELKGLEALLDDLSPLLLQVPAGDRWGIVSEYVSVGNLVEARYQGMWGHYEGRRWTLPCTVTARPVGGSQAAVTYAYSYGMFSTYEARYAAHATYGAALDPSS